MREAYLQETLTAGNPQRLLQAETELLFLFGVLHNKSIRRQEAPSLTTLKHGGRGERQQDQAL